MNIQTKKKKGETQAHIIMWIGVILAVFISILWVVKNVTPRHMDLETVNADLSDIKGHINTACISSYYKAEFNPRTFMGFLIINDTQICIDNHFDKCRFLMCETGLNQTIRLDNITHIIIEKDENFTITFE
jgi:hypothetical protein